MNILPDSIHPSWHPHLVPLFEDKKMQMIKNEILPSSNYYPQKSQIFRVFSTPLDSIKVIILGQDPYPNGEAIGLAFAVAENKNIPASLRIMKEEILKSSAVTDSSLLSATHMSIKWKSLRHWQEQGVFLLNTALTVVAKNAGSHLGYWQWFTREVIKIISEQTPSIWMLWGAKAQTFRDYISNRVSYSDVEEERVYLTGKENVILEAPHPAAQLYSGGKNTFSGCNHFNLCNDLLILKKKTIIHW